MTITVAHAGGEQHHRIVQQNARAFSDCLEALKHVGETLHIEAVDLPQVVAFLEIPFMVLQAVVPTLYLNFRITAIAAMRKHSDARKIGSEGQGRSNRPSGGHNRRNFPERRRLAVCWPRWGIAGRRANWGHLQQEDA